MSEIKPGRIIGPGKHIKDELEYLGWTQQDLAEVMGVSLKTVNLLIQDKTPLTFELAVKLAKAIGGTPTTWLNLYNMYRARTEELKLNESRENEEIEERSILYQYLPIREMKKRGWIENSKSFEEIKKSIVNLFGVNDFEELKKIFQKKEGLPAFRKSEAYQNFNVFHAYVWFLMAKKFSAKIKTSYNYDHKKLENLAKHIPQYSIRDRGVEEFLNDLENDGVKFLVFAHLQKTYIDGASFMDEDNPVIVYTKRYDRIDNFWFTLAHEIAHILYHEKYLKDEKVIIDDLANLKNEKIEKEANEIAGKWLKKDEILNCFENGYKYISEKKVLDCSKKLGMHPSLVVGILQHYEKLPRKNLDRFKEKVGELIPAKYYVEKQRMPVSQK
jgi:HTH-type transcriptional regulator/antitoxin HigA